MSANYAGLNIRPLRVYYTGFDSNGTRASRTAITLTNGRVPIGAILCKDPFQWENGGSGIGAATDNPTTGVRTGVFEGMDYTRPQTSILNQHKVVVIGGGEPPASNPNGGRWVDVIEVADACNVLLNGTVMNWFHMFLWIGAISILGCVIAIPMKRQMINIDQLPFPSGIAAAETIKSLHGHGDEAIAKARSLAIGGVLGGTVDDTIFPATMEIEHVRVYQATR